MPTITESDQSRSVSTSILERARNLDNNAWLQLMDIFGPLIDCWMRKRNVPRQDIPDLMQSVLCRAVAGIQRFQRDSRQDTFTGWLLVISQNAVRDHYRARPGLIGASEWLHEMAFAPTRQEERSARTQLLSRLFDRIAPEFTEKSMTIFCRMTMAGESAVAIASDYGMRPGAVREAKRKVLKRLRALCAELGLNVDDFCT